MRKANGRGIKEKILAYEDIFTRITHRENGSVKVMGIYGQKC